MIKLAKLNNKPEIFHSVQGEGKNMGKPSIFIRLSLCNLYCQWCDTEYTWNWEGTSFKHNYDQLPGYKKHHKENLIELLSNEQILATVIEMKCNNIVITGGEPLAQQKDLRSLMKALKEQNPNTHIEFETNGTLKPLPEVDMLADQYNVSIKLSNSNVALEDRIKPDAINFFAQSTKSNFKFVVDTEGDLLEILDLIKQYNINQQVVYLMPQGTTVASLKQKQQWIVEICKQNNFNYTDRLHIHIWGDKRGV
jgi:7-carboxy-7-deazaguanine synthase